MRRRFLTAAFGLAVFAGTVGLAALLPSGLFPEDDEARSELNFELPPGTTVAQAVAAAETITARLRARPEVVAVYASVGTATGNDDGPVSEEVRKGRAIVLLKPRGERSIDQRTFETQALADLAGLQDMRMNFKSGLGGREFSIVVSGGNVERAALTLERAISGSVPSLRNVASTVASSRSEIQIVPDLDKAADAGVSPASISETVRLATIGDTDRNLAQFSADDRRLGIRVQLAPHARLDPATFHHLRIRSQSGAMVPLGNVAEIRIGAGSTTIDRYDRQRRVTVEADLAPGAALGDALAAVWRLPEMKDIAPGVAVKEAGDAELMQEVFSAFAMAMAAGLLMVLAVLILLFADFLQPVTILLSLPLSVVGAFVALPITGNAMTLPVVIGLLMLMLTSAAGDPERGRLPGSVYVIMNTRLAPEFEVVQAQIVPTLGRSLTTVLKAHAKNTVLANVAFARSAGLDFNLTQIDRELPKDLKPSFDPEYMRAAYALGHNRAIAGNF